MKKFNLLKKNYLYVLLAVLTLTFLFSGVFLLGTTKVSAQTTNEIEVEDFLPLSNIERLKLSSPISVYHDDEVTAILEDTNKTIHVYKDGKYTEKTLDAQSLQKIDRLGDDFVLFNGNSLYLVSIDDFENIDNSHLFDRPIMYNNLNVGCANFNVWGEYISLISGQEVEVYKVQDTYVTKLESSITLTTSQTPPITSNKYGLYYIDSNKLVFSAYNDLLSDPTTILGNINSTILLANDNYLYYVTGGNSVHKVDLENNNDTTLDYKKITAEDFELGSLTTISNLSFKDDNLLITDKDKKTIEEYKIENGNLVFTGFAIASQKTAYNRISKDNLKVEYNGENVAVLDNNKITVIKDRLVNYSTDNFINFKFDKLGITPLTDICLGKNTLLGFNNKTLYAFDLTSKKYLGAILTSSFDIDDVSYRSGKYYVLSNDENTPKPSFVDEINESNLNSVNRIITLNGLSFNKIELDLLGNFYFTDSANLYTFNPNLDDTAKVVTALNGLVPAKISTDLSGKLFLASSNELYLLSGTNFNKIELNINVLDFALSFEKSTVYFIDGTSEKIYKTEKINNSSIASLSIPDGYTVNASTASLDNLLSASLLNDNANVFGYRIENNEILFTGLKNIESEYLVIDTILDKNSSEKFLMLVGKEQTVLVNDKDANVSFSPKLDAPKTVYVTTPVHAYYLPKITKTDDYVATLNENKIFLELGSIIYPQKEVSFNDTAFYFAKIVKDGKEYNLYVPKSFTTETIESAIETKSFTLKKIRPTTIYMDAELKNALFESTENISVRVFALYDGVYEIEYFNGETWVRGYVKEKDVLNEPNTAIRNVLIVLAVITCACGSTTFFIIRNKRKD